MSKAQDFETYLESIFSSILPEYTIFKEWNENGLDAVNGMQISVDYSTIDKTVEQRSKVQYKAVVYMYREYEETGDDTTAGETAKEQIRVDLEKIFNYLDFNFVQQDIFITTDTNRKNFCKTANFEIILN